jgi:hypothetical protein
MLLFSSMLPLENGKSAVIGLGYVGLPLAVETAHSGFKTIGFDLSETVVAGINRGQSHIKDIPSPTLEPLVKKKLIEATTNPADLAKCDGHPGELFTFDFAVKVHEELVRRPTFQSIGRSNLVPITVSRDRYPFDDLAPPRGCQ